ncbi:MAG: branched-chain amino acid ABC transporter permease [Proteobacteria bacterium]|nr:branched-chain amino acid ABC transporter permease [Pseudomonadota bacterium]MBU1451624.1 branched-chain amino acid ABC transporter permease [Pseudomonadota bacterium]MBU2469287.1 branched-chain amino acid ABC transporter permease [Pseudomonadota bacterium]MBU2517997.1 branched-chain amino acid ABC transporter permease [Pseudomonadota bacterium]
MAIRSKIFCETYHEDIKLLNTYWSKAWMGLFIIGLFILPFLGDTYMVYMVNLCCIATVAAVGLNLLTGFTGQISLGHAAFLAIGAYTGTILSEGLNMPFWVTVPAGGLVAAAAGILVGIPCLRLKGLYLAMATMSFGVMVEYVLITLKGVTGGERGMYMPEVDVFGMVLNTDESIYYFLLVITAIMIVAAKNIVRTRVGRAFVAVRDRDIAAEVMGVNLTLYKVMAFALSSFYAGVAGVMYAYVMGHIHPEHFTMLHSVEYLAMIIVGGLGSILGSIFGAIFIVVIPEFIKILAQTIEEAIPAMAGKYDDEWNIAAFGLLIMLFLIFEPGGLNSIWQRLKIGFKNWPFTY